MGRVPTARHPVEDADGAGLHAGPHLRPGSIVLTLKSGAIDFIGNSNKVCGNDFYQVQRGFKPNTNGYDQVNPYWFQDHYDGVAKEFLTEAFKALKSADWYDKSDAMTDYFNTAYYVDVNVGKWDKPYELV
jgi:hypothetical protein